MKNELGLKDGKPIVGSIWLYPKEAGGADRNFRIEVRSNGSSYETLSMQDGDRWIGGHGWSTERIIKEWKLVSVPGVAVGTPGLKDGRPLVGSSWRCGSDSGWDVLSVSGDRATIVGRMSKGTTGAAVSEFGVKYVFLAYPNELGLDAEGRPLNGSKWRIVEGDPYFKNDDRSRIYEVAPGVRNGGVPFVGGSWSETRSFKGPAVWRLVELPPQATAAKDTGELVWKPLDRAMPRWEEQARNFEAKGDHKGAKAARVTAATLVETDARIVAEESALKEKRYIAKSQLKRLTPGDRACYAMRGLKEFKLHTEAADYLYWE